MDRVYVVCLPTLRGDSDFTAVDHLLKAQIVAVLRPVGAVVHPPGQRLLMEKQLPSEAYVRQDAGAAADTMVAKSFRSKDCHIPKTYLLNYFSLFNDVFPCF